MKAVVSFIKDILIAVLIAAVILIFLKPIIVQQESMVPNFQSGDYLIISRQSYKLFGEMQRGDVIVFKSDLYDERGNQKNLIKRIIGLPGDKIEITGGQVYLNGELLDEDYIKEQGVSGEMEEITVPDKHLFVMGDNRAVSEDSRNASVGPIDESTVMGKVILRLYPFNAIKKF